jgi:hypothetical protein
VREKDGSAVIWDIFNEQNAPGATDLHRHLGDLVQGEDLTTLPHESIIAKLDESGRLFRILVLKSTRTIPYTSVFIELDCGYWTKEAEDTL